MPPAAFGFVYLHPFMDGNGRLHRFLIHHVLTHSGLLPTGTVVPVSAVILKNVPACLEVLAEFSQPVTRLWRYVRVEDAPHVSAHPGSRAYRFFDASAEVAFLHRMIQQAVEDEIPRELAWLSGYDKAFAQLDAEFDLPRKDLSALIRMAHSSQGRLSARRRAGEGRLSRSAGGSGRMNALACRAGLAIRVAGRPPLPPLNRTRHDRIGIAGHAS